MIIRRIELLAAVTIPALTAYGKQVVKLLTKPEKEALEAWTRHPNRVEPQQWQLIRSALAKSKLPIPLTLYRGTSQAKVRRLKIGSRYPFVKFNSFSIWQKAAAYHLDLMAPAMVEIQVPKGTPGLYLESISQVNRVLGNELEVLLGPFIMQVLSKEKIVEQREKLFIDDKRELVRVTAKVVKG